MQYPHEHTVVRRIGNRLLRDVAPQLTRTGTPGTKTKAWDIVSRVDHRVDRLVRTALRNAFPEDVIMTEESSPDALPLLLAGRRGWVVDPICGSLNISRGIGIAVTNIALVERGKVRAAWVVDYTDRELFWSVGGRRVYVGTRRVPRRRVNDVWIIEVDFGGYVREEYPLVVRRHFTDAVRDLLLLPEVFVTGLQSSLSFANVGVGRFDGGIVIDARPWDVLAAAFLTEQYGGVVTQFDGRPCSLTSRNLVFAGTAKIHRTILRILHKHGLGKLT